MKILSNPYTPFPLIACKRHVETIFAAFFRSIPQIRLRRECLGTAEDGAVTIDWVPGNSGRHFTGWCPRFNFEGVMIHMGGMCWWEQEAKDGVWLSLFSIAEKSNACPLSKAVSLCNPFNLVIADGAFRKGFNIVYDKALANALCRIFKKHTLLFEDMVGEYNIPSVANKKSVKEFMQD
ncbi:embryogenesis-associated protein EMB8-like isoform X2 [Tripterygium wilfordii]|uniref:Embryogenesis-associated protein EMB8-like isoform X2 n=1 Tax=Tripterygium wilfordii TaxID=458696 RepID=A0A7J7CJX9_TRIWF|nr:embryogenesis-associated protein EMB8-like isoform X2 [Tripterygium wilfordii]